MGFEYYFVLYKLFTNYKLIENLCIKQALNIHTCLNFYYNVFIEYMVYLRDRTNRTEKRYAKNAPEALNHPPNQPH